MSIPAPPLRELDKNKDVWTKWFLKLQQSLDLENYVDKTSVQTITNKTFGTILQSNLVSKIAPEDITGAWRIAKKRSVIYTNTGATLSTNDFGKVIKFDNGANHVVCTLPSVGVSDIDGSFIIMRFGTGRLTIKASDNDTIERSVNGGTVYCEESGRPTANITIYLATETKWTILAGTGIWMVV